MMTTTTRPPARRAFATLTALALVTLVGASLAALAVAFSTDLKRSVRQSDDAQLRQLLLAGEVAVRDALSRGPLANTTVPLPADVAGTGASLSYEKVDTPDAAETRVTVTAKLSERRSMSQTLSYGRVGERWQLRSMEL